MTLKTIYDYLLMEAITDWTKDHRSIETLNIMLRFWLLQKGSTA